MDDNKKDQNIPMSIEQAANYLKSQQETYEEDIKQEAAGQPISIALEEDRRHFLMSAMCYYNTCSPEVYRAFIAISGTISSSLTCKDVAALLKKIMILRINNYGIAQIAKHMKEPIECIASLEELGKISVQEEMKRLNIAGLPVFTTN